MQVCAHECWCRRILDLLELKEAVSRSTQALGIELGSSAGAVRHLPSTTEKTFPSHSLDTRQPGYCISHPASKRLPCATNGDHYRDPRLAKTESPCACPSSTGMTAVQNRNPLPPATRLTPAIQRRDQHRRCQDSQHCAHDSLRALPDRSPHPHQPLTPAHLKSCTNFIKYCKYCIGSLLYFYFSKNKKKKKSFPEA